MSADLTPEAEAERAVTRFRRRRLSESGIESGAQVMSTRMAEDYDPPSASLRAPGYRPLRPGDPAPPLNSIGEAQAYVERQAFRAYLLALLDEDPQFLAELRRRLTESDGS